MKHHLLYFFLLLIICLPQCKQPPAKPCPEMGFVGCWNTEWERCRDSTGTKINTSLHVRDTNAQGELEGYWENSYANVLVGKVKNDTIWEGVYWTVLRDADPQKPYLDTLTRRGTFRFRLLNDRTFTGTWDGYREITTGACAILDWSGRRKACRCTD